jgi:hypothetical protein
MRIRYPVAGDVYRSSIYPDQVCRVVRVINAIVTFKWLGQYSHIEEQSVTVLKFAQDFSHEVAELAASGRQPG